MPASIEILWENDDLIGIRKPADMLSIPDRFDPHKPNAFHLLKCRTGQLFIVHRLDKDTSGVLLFAKHTQAHKAAAALFEKRQVKKLYWAIAEGLPTSDTFEIDMPIARDSRHAGKMTVNKRGKTALTLVTVKEKFRSFSLLELQPLTGRTHQLRVHLAQIGCPIVGDPLYGSGHTFSIQKVKFHSHPTRDGQEIPLIRRTALHAYSLSFEWEGRMLCVQANLPSDMEICLKQLRKWNIPTKF